MSVVNHFMIINYEAYSEVIDLDNESVTKYLERVNWVDERGTAFYSDGNKIMIANLKMLYYEFHMAVSQCKTIYPSGGHPEVPYRTKTTLVETKMIKYGMIQYNTFVLASNGHLYKCRTDATPIKFRKVVDFQIDFKSYYIITLNDLNTINIYNLSNDELVTLPLHYDSTNFYIDPDKEHIYAIHSSKTLTRHNYYYDDINAYIANIKSFYSYKDKKYVQTIKDEVLSLS